MTGFSRRGFLSGVAGVSALAFARNASAAEPESEKAQGGRQEAYEARPLAEQKVPFDGEHQAGVETPVQSRLNLVGLDLKDGVTPEEFVLLIRLWTEDARALCSGKTPAGSLEPELADAPANLTISCGFGEPLFEKLGISDKKPAWLRDIRAYDKDELDPQWGQTDLVLQICSDDGITIAHALRHMVQAGSEYTTVKWLQQGFQNTPGLRAEEQTPRNLFGQKDGTINPRESEEFADQVWIDDGPEWLRGGTAMVVRRIHMNIDTWEEADRATRENAIGRDLPEGAPLSGGDEFTPADYDKRDQYGLPAIDKNSHMARATAPDGHPEQKLLRRVYSYDLPTAGGTTGTDELSNSGLVFVCFQKDPTQQFEPIQARLDEADLLNEWITHIGSAVYAFPRGTTNPADGGKGDTYWAEALLKGLK